MQAFKALEGLASNKLEEMKSFISMIKLEAKLAGLSVFPLIVNVCMLFVILITIWLTAMCMLGFAVIWAYDSTIIGLASVLLFNTILLGLLFIYLNFNLKKMSFEKTRKYLGAQ